MSDDETAISRWVMFPSLLYGNSRTVRAATKALAKAAVQNGSWSGILDTLPRTSILEDDTPVQVADHNVFSPSEDLWRVFYLEEALLRATGFERRALFRDLWIGVTTEFWASLTLLDPSGHFGFNPSTTEYSWNREREWRRTLLSQVVRWLPEIECLRERIVVQLKPDMRSLLPNWHGMLEWASGILGLCGSLGVSFSREELWEEWGDDITGALLSRRVIRHNGDRYVLALN